MYLPTVCEVYYERYIEYLFRSNNTGRYGELFQWISLFYFKRGLIVVRYTVSAISDANFLLNDIVNTYSDHLWGWPHYRVVGGGGGGV